MLSLCYNNCDLSTESTDCSMSYTDNLQSHAALSGLGKLHITSPATPVNPLNRCLPFEVPAELRNSIYENVLRRGPPRINLDLSHAFNPTVQAGLYTFSIAMTCRRIHNECAKVLYTVNRVIIHAPVFGAHQSDPMTVGATYKDEIAARLRTIAQRQISLQQFQDVKIHLGTLPSLRAL
ncbi:hypothetical protein DOTSEDRAFT_34435 [Dothistroma septosporum NZE10]|uniref:Uncharacterized protein n=1 Tax=Dothistroma septosporum (strain NZE10 / CBS 128990) TaxID=675120 RepID=N1PN71_DOTSN|nr:hypothetical protein DOTSEDRAFT_34435 [Dothistroma septosporum NZE10]